MADIKIVATIDGVETVFVPEVAVTAPTQTIHVKEGETVEIVADGDGDTDSAVA